MKPSTFFALVAILTIPAISNAQFASIGTITPTVSNTGALSGAGTISRNESLNTSNTTLNYKSIFKGDMIFAGNQSAPMLNSSLTSSLTGVVVYETGAVPVKITDFKLTYEGKRVLSGGFPNSVASSTLSITASWNNVTNPNMVITRASVNADPGAHNSVVLDNVTANGDDPTFILNANSIYHLTLNLSSFYTFTPMNTPPPGFAIEYGGTNSPQFAGFQTSFNAQAVPEPTTLALLLVPAIATFIKKRK
ncbi:MAG: PEP-CTERM sorting domain-containing protein [Fimbriimonadaceae bacterium]